MCRTLLRGIFCLGLMPSLGFSQAGREEVQEGNDFFAEGRFDEAQKKYRKALQENPSSPVIRYNLGDAEYKRNQYEQAVEAFSQSLQTGGSELQGRASYNLGNALYRLGKLGDSIQGYKEALRINPDDRDSKQNLEFVRSKLEEQQKQQQQDQKDQEQEQEQEQDKEDQDQSQSQQQNQEQNQGDQQKPEDGSQGEQQDQQDQKNQQAEQQPQDSQDEQAEAQSAAKMSREEAEHLLEALSENSQQLGKKKRRAKGRIRVEKDW